MTNVGALPGEKKEGLAREPDADAVDCVLCIPGSEGTSSEAGDIHRKNWKMTRRVHCPLGRAALCKNQRVNSQAVSEVLVVKDPTGSIAVHESRPITRNVWQ